MRTRLFVTCVLRSRCPCCARGALFETLLRFRKQCPECGLVYDQWVGEWITPTYIASSLGMVCGFGLMAVMLFTGSGLDASWTEELAVCGTAAGVALLTLRPAKAGWLAFLYWVGAVEVSARTRARLRWDEPAGRMDDVERMHAAERRARTVRPRPEPPVSPRARTLWDVLLPRVARQPRPKPGRSPEAPQRRPRPEAG